MPRLEFLLEEPSMEAALEILLPKILPPQWKINENVFLRPHQGKGDLRKSIPTKVRAFAHQREAIGIVVLHDQDANDCVELKQSLLSLCNANLQGASPPPHLVRIVCRELEAWYLGDMDAIQTAYPDFKASQHRNRSKFRTPDSCNAKDELRKILPAFQQIATAKAIAPHLDIEANRSRSFQNFVSGLHRFVTQFQQDSP